KNLPHLHRAMKARLEPLKLALAQTQSEEKPLKHEPRPTFQPLSTPQPVTADGTAAASMEALLLEVPKKGEDPAGALAKRVEKPKGDLTELLRSAERPLLDRYWFETVKPGSTAPREDIEPAGEDRKKALRPMFEIRDQVSEHIFSAETQLKQTRRENPYLLA